MMAQLHNKLNLVLAAIVWYIYEYIIIIWNLFYKGKNEGKKIGTYFIPSIIQTME